jgi:C4-dicarboxylate-specific signal transduction histidine kinase
LELAHAKRVATIGQLSASIAHEVNQPIAAGLTNAQTALRWLEATPPNLDKARQAVDRIIENGRRAGEVIAGIRALIRKDPPRQDPITMNDIVLEVVSLTRGEATKNSVSVRTRLTGALPIVRGDKVQLQQVILNLVMNAIEAMMDASYGRRELLLSTAEDGSEGALVSVAESGPGLNGAWSERMFEAFNTTKASGLGMGLAICRTIVEAHGGRLWAADNVPCGAVFQFTVPGLPE